MSYPAEVEALRARIVELYEQDNDADEIFAGFSGISDMEALRRLVD